MIGHAYLETETLEKVCLISEAEFDLLEEHGMVVFKALYGLHFVSFSIMRSLGILCESLVSSPHMQIQMSEYEMQVVCMNT